MLGFISVTLVLVGVLSAATGAQKIQQQYAFATSRQEDPDEEVADEEGDEGSEPEQQDEDSQGASTNDDDDDPTANDDDPPTDNQPTIAVPEPDPNASVAEPEPDTAALVVEDEPLNTENTTQPGSSTVLPAAAASGDDTSVSDNNVGLSINLNDGNNALGQQ